MGRTVPSTLTQVKDILCWGQNRGKFLNSLGIIRDENGERHLLGSYTLPEG